MISARKQHGPRKGALSQTYGLSARRRLFHCQVGGWWCVYPICGQRVSLPAPTHASRIYECVFSIHWIAPECYLNKDQLTPEADIWALATTFYEMFTWGEPIPSHLPVSDMIKVCDKFKIETCYLLVLLQWYQNGNRLSRPSDCPEEVYNIMIQAWIPDPHLRKVTQEISRDMNQLVYQLFNDRHERAYNELVEIPTRADSSETVVTTTGTGNYCLVKEPENNHFQKITLHYTG